MKPEGLCGALQESEKKAKGLSLERGPYKRGSPKSGTYVRQQVVFGRTWERQGWLREEKR